MPAEMEIGATNLKCVHNALKERPQGKAPCPDQCGLGRAQVMMNAETVEKRGVCLSAGCFQSII